MRIGQERYYLATVAPIPATTGSSSRTASGWAGRRSLGLEGVVQERALATVIRGVDPSTGEVLSESAPDGRVRVGAFDLTFAPPKSVSLLHTLGSEAAVAEVARRPRRGRHEVLGYLERRGGRVVRRSVAAPARCWRRDGLVAAGFVHRTSRAPIPHLHTHVLVVNCARGDDGRWSAPRRARRLPARPHRRRATTSRTCASSSPSGSACPFGPPGRSAADIEGFDAGLLRAFSRRSLEIRARLEELGHGGTACDAGGGCRDPPREGPRLPYDELVAGWRERAAELASPPPSRAVGRRRGRTPERRAPHRSSPPTRGRRPVGAGSTPPSIPRGDLLARPVRRSPPPPASPRRELLRARAQLERDGTGVLAAEAAVDSALAGDRFVESGSARRCSAARRPDHPVGDRRTAVRDGRGRRRRTRHRRRRPSRRASNRGDGRRAVGRRRDRPPSHRARPRRRDRRDRGLAQLAGVGDRPLGGVGPRPPRDRRRRRGSRGVGTVGSGSGRGRAVAPLGAETRERGRPRRVGARPRRPRRSRHSRRSIAGGFEDRGAGS